MYMQSGVSKHITLDGINLACKCRESLLEAEPRKHKSLVSSSLYPRCIQCSAMSLSHVTCITHAHTHTHNTHRHTQTDTDTHTPNTHRLTCTYTHTYIYKNTHTHTHTQKHTHCELINALLACKCEDLRPIDWCASPFRIRIILKPYVSPPPSSSWTYLCIPSRGPG